MPIFMSLAPFMSSLIPAPLPPVNQATERSGGAKTQLPREPANVPCLPPSVPTKKVEALGEVGHQSINPTSTNGGKALNQPSTKRWEEVPTQS